MKVIVVVPTYNEAENLPELVHRLQALGLPGLEVLIVDDSSPDGTAEVAERLARESGVRLRLLRRPARQGLGPAYVAGLADALAAGADALVTMDADLSHTPECIPALLERLGDADLVVGSRWVPGGGADASWGLLRRWLSRGASLYARLVLRLRLRDATSGFKCFRREALADIELGKIKSRGFAFQIEVAYLCQRRGWRIAEVPIRFAGRRRGRSKLSPPIIFEALWRVLALRLR